MEITYGTWYVGLHLQYMYIFLFVSFLKYCWFVNFKFVIIH